MNRRTGEDRILTVPNVLSLVRLLLIPVFFYLYVFAHQEVWGMVVFAVAACTDWIDGSIARHANCVTRLGRVLDPFVDRCLIIFGIIAVVATGKAPVWIMVLIFARDIILGIFTLKLKKNTGNDLVVSYVGKTATAFIMVAFCMLMLNWPLVPGLGWFEISWLPGFGAGTFSLGIFVAYVGVVLQWIVAVIYLYRGAKYGTTAYHGGGQAAVVLVALLVSTVAIAAMAPHNAQAAVLDTDVVGTTVLSENSTVRAEAPDVECKQGGLVTSSGKVLWQRDANTQVPIASLTKIMTAYVALQKGQLSDQIFVSANAARTEGSTANLAEGDMLTLGDMLSCMMLPSGNDAAVAIAEHYGNGNVDEFVVLMNSAAAELGMTSTHFANPSGLVDDNNYSTVNDYFKLVCAVMQNSTFAQTVAQQKFDYFSTARGSRITLFSTNNLLSTFEGATGVKTGFTDAAGYCFVGSAEQNGIELYSVVFNAPTVNSRFTDAKDLLNWGFEHYHEVTLIEGGQTVGQAVATDWIDKTVGVIAEKPTTAIVFDYDPDLSQTIEIHDRGGVIEQGSDMGIVVWTQGDTKVAEVYLVAAEGVEPPTVFESLQIWWMRFCSFFTGDTIKIQQTIDLPDTFALIGSKVAA